MEGGLTVLDHHLYRCFTSEDIHTPALSLSQAIDPATNGSTHQHFSSISQKLSNSGGSGLVVGEWSGALNPGSLSGSTTNGFNETKSYVDAQLRLYESQACAGWFFWTYKKGHPGDSGWSLRDAVKKGTFPHYVGIRSSSGRRMDGNEAAVVDAKMKTKAIARGQLTFVQHRIFMLTVILARKPHIILVPISWFIQSLSIRRGIFRGMGHGFSFL